VRFSMAAPPPPPPPELTDDKYFVGTAAFVQNLWVSAVLGASWLVLFELLRRWGPSWRVYLCNTLESQRSYLVERAPKPCPRAPFAWLPSALAMTHAELRATMGLDEYLFLRFVRMGFKWLSLAAALSLAIILPINATAGDSSSSSNLDPKLVSGINSLTMAKIENGSSRLWAHLVVYVACSAWLMALLWGLWAEFEVYSGEWFASDISAAEQHAVLVTNVPLRPAQPRSSNPLVRRPTVEGALKFARRRLGHALRGTASWLDQQGLDRSEAHALPESLDREATDFNTELPEGDTQDACGRESTDACTSTESASTSANRGLAKGAAAEHARIDASGEGLNISTVATGGAGGALEPHGSALRSVPRPMASAEDKGEGVSSGSEEDAASQGCCGEIASAVRVVWDGTGNVVRWAALGVLTGLASVLTLVAFSAVWCYRMIWAATFECLPFDALPMKFNVGDNANVRRMQAKAGLVRGTSDTYATVSARVHGLFSTLFPGDYVACWLVPDTRRLDELSTKRTNALRTLASAQHALLKGGRALRRTDAPPAALGVAARGVAPADLGFPDCSHRSSDEPTDAHIDVELGAMRKTSSAVPAEPTAAPAAEPPPDTTKVLGGRGRSDDSKAARSSSAECCHRCGCDCLVLCCSCVCCCQDISGARRRQVRQLLQRVHAIDEAIEREYAAVLKREPTSSAVVIFNNRRAAATASAMLLAQGPAWRAAPCPGATDLQWKNLIIDEETRFLRSGRAALWAAALILVFTIPVSALQNVLNCDNLSWMCNWGEFFANFVNGTLQGMIQSIFLILGHMASLLAARFSGDASLAQQYRRASWTYFALILINLWLVILVTRVGNIWNVGQWFSDLGNVWESLGLLIPITSTYFLNYVVFRTFSALAMEMISLPLLIQYWWRMGIARVRDGVTTIAECEHQAGPIPFPFHRLVAQVSFVFALACIYLVIAPVTAGFCWLFFLILTPVLRFNMVYKYHQTFASGGRIWPMIFSQCMVGLIVAQITLTGVFFVKQAWVVGGFSCALVVVTIVWWVVAHERFGKTTRSLPLRLNAEQVKGVPQRARWSGLDEQRALRSVDGARLELADHFAPPRLAQAIGGDRPGLLAGPASHAPSSARASTELVRARLAQAGIYRERTPKERRAAAARG